MTRLVPWGLGWRSVVRHRRVSLFLMLATAIIVAAPFAAGTIALTSAFSADEVAQISIGQSDVRARTTQFQVGARDDAPQPGSGGITEVLEDRDLAVNVAGESSQLSMTGRWLEYRAPLADGILTFRESSSGPAEVALSASAQSELGVALGDEVVILGSDVSLTVTDIVAYAPDTAAPLIVINPEAVTSDEADALLADSGSVRWLLATDDLDATLGELESLGLIAETRTALTAFEGAELVNPIAVAAVCGIAGIVILAAAGAARSGSRRRIVQTLNRLGTTSSEANAVTRIESVVVTGAGASWLGRWGSVLRGSDGRSVNRFRTSFGDVSIPHGSRTSSRAPWPSWWHPASPLPGLVTLTANGDRRACGHRDALERPLSAGEWPGNASREPELADLPLA